MRTRIDGVRRAVYSTPWALWQPKLDAMLDMLEMRANGVDISPEQREQLLAERRATKPEQVGSVVILPLYDVICQRADMVAAMSGGTSTEKFGAAFDEAVADDNVSVILIDADSPGGCVYGVPELAQKIFLARKKKRIIGVANATAFSAGYYILSACGEVFVTPSGAVGSVGVYSAHDDISAMAAMEGVRRTYVYAGRYKVEGNPYEPLGDEAKAYMQEQTDDYYAMFVNDVARFRGVSADDVLANFGEGRTLLAARAVAAGMADGVISFDDLLAQLNVAGPTPAAADVPPVQIVLPGAPDNDDDDDDGPEASARSNDGFHEVRSLEHVECRAANAEGVERLEGTGVPYGRMSEPMRAGGLVFREIFEPGAFADSIARDDIHVLWQHDPACVFGRTRAGTARVTEREDRVDYVADPPNAQWARDAMESVRRGDVTHNSFAFMVAPNGDRFERRDGVAEVVRVISKATMREVGPQTFPAYRQTSVVVSQRALQMVAQAIAGMQAIDSHTVSADARASDGEPHASINIRRAKLKLLAD